MRTSFFANTTSDIFAGWLEHRTSHAYTEQYPTQKGRISLDRARFDRARGTVVIGGAYYIVPKEEDSETAYLLSEVISFKMVPLAADRIEVLAACNQPVVGPFFEQLLGEIAARWPEPRSIMEGQQAGLSSLEGSVARIQQLQQATYALLAGHDQRVSREITEAVQSGLLTESEARETLTSVNRALKLLLASQASLSEDIRRALSSASATVTEDLSTTQRLEICIPIIPILLQYKAEVALRANADLSAAIDIVEAQWGRFKSRAQARQS
jgi:hypothetical protein